MRISFLFSPPDISEEEIQAVVNTLRSNWITTGPVTKAFEEEFAAYHGLPGSLALNSCTAGAPRRAGRAGHRAGRRSHHHPHDLLRHRERDRARRRDPVLADVDARHPEYRSVERAFAPAITPRTKAIIPVHFGGHPVDLDGILALAQAHGLTVIDDAAHALPARYRGQSHRHDCGLHRLQLLRHQESDHRRRRDADRRRRSCWSARVILRLHGMNRDAWKRYECRRQLVLRSGRARLQVQHDRHSGRHRAGAAQPSRRDAGAAASTSLERYQRRLCRPRSTSAAHHSPGSRVHAYHLYVLRINPEVLDIDRAQFIDELKAYGVGTSVHFIPNSRAAVLPRQV